MAHIILSDGTVINNLAINGDNFISFDEITEDIFEMNLSPVTIVIDEEEDTHDFMKLIQITHPNPSEWWFVIQDMTDEELYKLDIESKLDYLAMMSDIDLDEE